VFDFRVLSLQSRETLAKKVPGLKIPFETDSCYIACAGLVFSIFLLLPPQGWDYRCLPLHLASPGLVLSDIYSYMISSSAHSTEAVFKH
jgi:hypothetical protein